jgi:hypothetical protein
MEDVYAEHPVVDDVTGHVYRKIEKCPGALHCGRLVPESSGRNYRRVIRRADEPTVVLAEPRILMKDGVWLVPPEERCLNGRSVNR